MLNFSWPSSNLSHSHPNTFPLTKGTNFERHLFEELENKGFGKWGVADTPHEMARLMIEHIDKKREALGINKQAERKLSSMEDRRAMEG